MRIYQEDKYSEQALELMSVLYNAEEEQQLFDGLARILELEELDGVIKMWIGHSLDGPYILTSDRMFHILRKTLGRRKTAMFSVDGQLYTITFVRAVHSVKKRLPPAISFRKVAPPENHIIHRK